MNTATPPGGDTAPANDAPLSLREGAQALTEIRRTSVPSSPEGEAAELQRIRDDRGRFAQRNSDEESDITTPGLQDPGEGETAGDDTAGDLPPIDPPRSWSKAQKEKFESLPREVQEVISEREKARETELRRGQNESAESRKKSAALEQAMVQRQQQYEHARTQYEQALPLLLQRLQNTYSGEFSDIRSLQDVQKLANDDPIRFTRWQAHKMQIDQVANEIRGTQVRQQREMMAANEQQQAAWNNWAADQDKLFVEQAPEFSDPKKVTKARESMITFLTEDLGLSKDDLQNLWTGQASLSLRDHRVQLVLRDAVKWREAQKQAKAAAKPTMPAPQRPGTAAAPTPRSQADIDNLSDRLNSAPTLREQLQIAAQLKRAQRTQRR